ncbi:ROK family protein [Nocardioides sp.]|uniref:ROK family transcriptional regulator n=1 Tax=Nocardioides sp. TaxID=35761 RepID=UPI0035277B85
MSTTPTAPRPSLGRALRPRAKVLPEDARRHNRSLVLQTLYAGEQQSRADLARSTGLTRVTVSDLVAGLLGEGLVVETGPSSDARPGKPATMLVFDDAARQVVGLDLSGATSFRGALLDLRGRVLERREVPLDGATGHDALALVLDLAGQLAALAGRPLLGVGIGSPGVVDLSGVVRSAPNLGWRDLDLRGEVSSALGGVPTRVANDANAAALAEHSFGAGEGDLMVVRIGHGVGAGLLVGGTPLFGSHFAAGEIGHVVVGTDGGRLCACGKHGCLETWLSTPNLHAQMDQDGSGDPGAVLREAGRRLGVALAPIVGALDLAEIVLSGPPDLLEGDLAGAAIQTLHERTMPDFHGHLTVRMSGLGDDIVVQGAAVMVLSGQLGVS